MKPIYAYTDKHNGPTNIFITQYTSFTIEMCDNRAKDLKIVVWSDKAPITILQQNGTQTTDDIEMIFDEMVDYYFDDRRDYIDMPQIYRKIMSIYGQYNSSETYTHDI